jgi:MerR family mercuric resistance operon transcriptional regulator
MDMVELTCKVMYPVGMRTSYTIGQLAHAAGVPTSTARYYERIGLLRATGRTAGNYRFYSEEALERLRFIRAAQVTGFTLEDITALLNLRDGTTAVCQAVQTLIEERLSDVDKRMADLRHVESVLKASLEMCRQSNQNGRCEVITQLTVASSSRL